ncbi:MAG: protein kinase [Acidobacteriota bacterium]
MATILVIDDDPDILVLVRHALDGAGHRTVTSSDPAGIADLAAAEGVDCVVLDVMMPDLSGHDALRLLRGHPRTGGVPVLLLSSRAESQDRVQGLRVGADDFLSKPFEPEELVLRIERLVASRTPAVAGPWTSDPNLKESLRTGRVVGSLFLGRYQALDVVGEGGSGLVFRGWDPWLKRAVALKTLRIEGPAAPPASSNEVADLLGEAVTVARFSHPNIVTVYDLGGSSEVAFIAMEFVDGTSLAQYLERSGRLAPAQVVPLALGIARGLEAAHGHRIVHQDVKPGNVLLGYDGSIKVSDFGVARLLTSLSQDEGTVFGTPGFLPPEILLGEPHSEAADLFGLGAVLFQCLTGVLPFAGDSLHQLVRNTVRQGTPSPRSLVPEVSPELDLLVREMLAKDPEARLGQASEAVDRLMELPGATESWIPEAMTREAETPAAFRARARSMTVPADALAAAKA